jgi:hypothetical protein
MPAFHQRVIDIATPGHDDYGRHLSKDEIDAQLRPSHKTTAAITNWLLASGISPNSINEQGHWFTFNATVKNAEVLLGADFAYYQHNDDSSLRLVRTLQYSVPNDIRSHIDLIQPTTRFGQPQAQAKLVKNHLTTTLMTSTTLIILLPPLLPLMIGRQAGTLMSVTVPLHRTVSVASTTWTISMRIPSSIRSLEYLASPIRYHALMTLPPSSSTFHRLRKTMTFPSFL